MSATSHDPSAVASSAALDKPLEPSQLTPPVAQLLAGATPAKMMAARGIAPLRPADLGLAIYQLTFDADGGVAEAARLAAKGLPDRLLVAVLKEALPGPVLHFFAAGLEEQRAEALEAALYNRAVPDATFVALAGRVSESYTEVICQNEARLLRCPAIVAALFGNPAARMSSVNRAIELCARNDITVDIAGFDEIVKAIVGDPSATDAAQDSQFEALAQALSVEEDEAEAALAAEAAATDVAGGDAAKKRAGGPKKLDVIIDFSRLKIYEKVRLATFGNSYCRNNLIRDPNRLVAMSVIKSPKITDSEIVGAAASRNVHEDVIRYISNQREFTKTYAVRWGLVNNPKCPLQTAIRLLSSLNMNDIKKVSSSRNIATALATTAKRIVQTKGAG